MAEKKLDKKYIRIYLRFFKTLGTVALSIAFVAVLAAVAIYGTINFSSKNYKSYYNTMVSEYSYYERARENLRSELEVLDLPEGVTSEGIYSSVDMEEFNIYAGKYLIYACKKTFYDPDTVFEEEYNTKSLDKYFSESRDASAKAQVISCIADSVKFLPDEKYNRAFNRVNTAFEEMTSGKFTLSDFYNMVEGSAFRFFDAILIAALILFLLYKINEGHLKRSFYIIGSGALTASTVLLIPSVQVYKSLMKFVRYDSSSFARELLSISHEKTAHTLLAFAIIFFVISIAVYIPSLVIYAKHRAKIHRSRHK